MFTYFINLLFEIVQVVHFIPTPYLQLQILATPLHLTNTMSTCSCTCAQACKKWGVCISVLKDANGVTNKFGRTHIKKEDEEMGRHIQQVI